MELHGVEWGGPGNIWIRTPTGWTVKRQEADDNIAEHREEEEERSERIRPEYTVAVRADFPINGQSQDAPVGRCIPVQGLKGQRRVAVCLSDALQLLQLKDAATRMVKFRYLNELMTVLMRDFIMKVSSTSQRQFMQILELMVNNAIQTETHIRNMKALISVALVTMENTGGTGHLGCVSMWKRHIQNVTNMRTKLDNFRYKEREEDAQPFLTDLPKECVRHIMMYLTDPKDLISLGAANEELYYMSRDQSLWQRLTGLHFSEKQMLKYDCVGDNWDGVDWLSVFPKCYRKFGLRKLYTDLLVICTGCKTMFWRCQYHECRQHDGDTGEGLYNHRPILEPVYMDEFIQIFKL